MQRDLIRAETLDSNFSLGVVSCSRSPVGMETERQYMKRISNSHQATMDDIYYVSAADVADKIIDRMRRGLDPLLFGNSSLALFSLTPTLRTRSRPKSD